MSSKSTNCARMSDIARNVKNGVYAKMQKFANYGSVVEDSIFAQQKQAERRLLEIQAQRELRKVKGVS